jgi:pantothenate kinase-related protein Tda10
MTEEQKTTNKIAKIAKQMRNTPQAESLRNEFMRTIVSYSNNLPQWGGLNIKML